MKNIFLIVSIIFCSGLCIQAQVLAENDSLQYFLDKKEFISYFKRIKILGDSAYSNSDEKALLELSKMLQIEFDSLTNNQKVVLRDVATRVGQKVFRLTGNIDESLAIYLVAHENVLNKEFLDSIAWYVENPIFHYYTMKGDYERADYFATLLENSLIHYHKTQFLTRHYTNLGTKFKSELKIRQAIDVFKKGLSLADSIDYENGVFSNALSLVGIYNDILNLDTSEKYLVISKEYLPNLVDDARYLEKKADLEIEVARNKSIHGNYSESIPLYRNAIQTLANYYPKTDRREFAKYYTFLASDLVRIDSFQSGLEEINHGLISLIPELENDQIPETHQLYPENSFIDLFALDAEAYQKAYLISGDKKDLEKALSYNNLALYVSDLVRESVLADPSKLVIIKSNKELIERGIDILYKLYSGEKSQAIFLKTRALFNRSKALLFDEKSRKGNLISILSKSDKEKWTAFQIKLLELHEKKFEPASDINSINGDILDCMNQIDLIFESYKDIELNIQVPENYIEYLVTDNDVYVLAELNGQKIFSSIGTTDKLTLLIKRLNEFILLKGLSLDEPILNDLFRFLIEPLNTVLPDYFVIIPDGAIGYIPFEMLRNDQGIYLIENSVITYGFEYINYVKKFEGKNERQEIFCLAPEYVVKPSIESDKSRGGIYKLPFARVEVDSISALFAGSSLVSQSTDKSEWQRHIGESRIFHYAGHAIIEGDKAFLALTDSEDEHQQITSAEINLMHNPLELVVLSACETGLGKLEEGEGIRSLGRSFMESGAQATIISLWNVNDRSTAKIMTGFYKYLKTGIRKDEALRQSKLDYLKSATLRNLHPYYWAAFIPAGDMSPIE